MSRTPWSPWQRRGAAALCVLSFALHAANHASRGNAWDAFWACHWATLLIGAGALLGQARLNGIGLVWLVLGNVLWAIDLAGGGEWMWTSALTHWASLAVGVAAGRWLGYPRNVWWQAHLALVGWQQFTRLFTPAWRNINVAFSVHPSVSSVFPSYFVYWWVMLGFCAAVMFAGELLWRRVLPPYRPSPGP